MKIFLLSLTLFFILSSEVGAKDRDLDDIVSRVQKNYGTMKDYRASFSQESKIKAYPRPQLSSGETYFKKPGKMRWDYKKPEKQEIVTDGKTVWMYTPSLNQVMKADFEATNQSKVAQAFLSGMGNIKKDFHISLGEDDKKGEGFKIVLVPKDENDSIKSLELTIDDRTYYVKKSVMTDVYDNVTTVSFSDFKVNVGVSDKVFIFKIPEGVDIVTPPAMQ